MAHICELCCARWFSGTGTFVIIYDAKVVLLTVLASLLEPRKCHATADLLLLGEAIRAMQVKVLKGGVGLFAYIQWDLVALCHYPFARPMNSHLFPSGTYTFISFTQKYDFSNDLHFFKWPP